ncbi:MAG: pentapeptide repeat-containing protein [Microcoleaceae cyanobacterium]
MNIEGLWPHNTSPNRLAILERKLAIWLHSQNLSDSLQRATKPYKSGEELQHLMQQAATEGCDFSQFQQIVSQIIEAKTDDFLTLAEIAKLDPQIDFQGARLLGVNLRGLDLSGVNFQQAYLRGADLSDIDLSNSDLMAVNLSGADLSGALLSDANLSQGNLHRVSLALANLSGANLNQVNLTEANLSNCNLSHANLSGAILKNADLYQAGLALTNLSEADLTGANVQQARLWHDAGLSENTKQELIQRGAIFED